MPQDRWKTCDPANCIMIEVIVRHYDEISPDSWKLPEKPAALLRIPPRVDDDPNTIAGG